MPHVNTFQSKNVKCKYYCKESPIAIKCKGLCGTHTCNVFKTKADKTEWIDEFCNGLAWNCPLYIALDIDNGES